MDRIVLPIPDQKPDAFSPSDTSELDCSCGQRDGGYAQGAPGVGQAHSGGAPPIG